MGLIKRTLADAATYQRLVYLLSGIPLGLTWFVALVTVWSLCLGLVITPFVIPLVIGLAFMTRGFAAVEAELARSLLAADAQAPRLTPPRTRRLRDRVAAMFGPGFWRAQAYLLIRWFVGFPVGSLLLGLLVAALGMIFAPLWLPFVNRGVDLGFWRPHTIAHALVFVPLGLVLLPITLLVVQPIAGAFRPIASALLRSDDAMVAAASEMRGGPPAKLRRPAFNVHAAVDGAVLLVLTLIWALTSRGYFWPVWVALPLALALSIHRWFMLLDERPAIVGRFLGSRLLSGAAGVGAAVSTYFIAIWAITGHGYFWPVWPMFAIAIVLGLLALSAVLSAPDRAEMAERIETLESTRAGAVNLQDSELRRIERDLHDGAQARLVALGMNLGLAEQRLADDPERVGELIAEARAGAEHALRELRDLARGIHPPVLADRGLEAALRSLVSSTPMRVNVSVELDERPAGAVESAAYFVAAEALANAGKHAGAERVEIRIRSVDGVLELTVDDDGRGGADPNGTGLLGMRRRVEALDGTLSVTSPVGGPTTIRAELPCGS